MMARRPERCQNGFTLLEILVVFSIMGVLWGVGLSVMPRLLSGSGPGSLARRMAGSGQEARQMALLQQRPWELLVDLDQGVFYRAPLGAVAKRERLEREGPLPDQDNDENSLAPREAQPGDPKEQDLVAQRRKELELQPGTTLRTARRYDSVAYTHNDTDSDITTSTIPAEVAIVQIWRQGGRVAREGRISLVFGPRGFILPAAVWFEAADAPGKDRYTVYFSGVVPPEVTDGFLLPDERGLLTAVELP